MISNVFSLHISLTLSAKTPAAFQMYFASITPLFVSILYVSFSFSIPETSVLSFTSTPFNTAVSASARANSHGLTLSLIHIFAELYKRWLEVKAPKLGSSRLYTLKAAYKYCQKLYGKKYRQIRAYHMQATMDDCGRGYATQSHIKALWWHLDNFAFELDIIDKMYSQIISVSTEQGETKRTPFTCLLYTSRCV